jgi:hypothetical protein
MVGDAYNRRANVDGEVLTFGREPVYVRAAELPPQLADDPYLRIEAVDSPPSGVPIIDLKSERIQEPTAEALPGPETDLKSERVQEPTAAAAPVYAAPSRRKRG